MNILRKYLCLMLCLVMSTYTLPVLAAGIQTSEEMLKTELTDEQMQHAVGAGNVDATMSEYVRFDPTQKPVAEAVVSNRSLLTLPYVLEITDTNGVALEELATGILAPGETKVVSGSGTGTNVSTVRITVGSAGSGLVAIDTAYLKTQR